jgi:hypothetical protein
MSYSKTVMVRTAVEPYHYDSGELRAVARGARVAALRLALAALLIAIPYFTGAAPDEQRLGRDQGYPVGGARDWEYDESKRVGSFTHQGEIPGPYRSGVHELAPAGKPMPLPVAPLEHADHPVAQGAEYIQPRRPG